MEPIGFFETYLSIILLDVTPHETVTSTFNSVRTAELIGFPCESTRKSTIYVYATYGLAVIM
jgi:hypothetical protein